MRAKFALALAVLLVPALYGMPRAARADDMHTDAPIDVPMLDFMIGRMGVFDHLRSPEDFGIEYRWRSFSKWKLVPAVGLSAVANGARYAYAGLRRDFWIDQHWVLTPSFSAGAFQNGSGFDLGYTLEFRSAIEAAYRFHNNWRVGFAFFHISNARLSPHNPGTEGLVFSVAIPLSGN